MKVTALLSDLKSLSVCSHESAINLVKTYKSPDTNGEDNGGAVHEKNTAGAYGSSTTTDEDLRRADELVSLHQNVKLKHMQAGPDRELLQARQAVQAVLASLARQT